MIEKMLDKYYTNKLKDIISTDLITYYLDYQFKEDSDLLYVYVKKKKYDKKHYEILYTFRKRQIITLLFDLEKLSKLIKERVDFYFKGEE